MVFTRSGNSKRGNHSFSSNHNMKNVPRFNTIKDYIIQRNVVENEEFKIWKDHWSTMFESITALKPLEFKQYKGIEALEKYESEAYKNVTIAASKTDENVLFMQLNDDEYIYRVDLDFEKIKNGFLDFWKVEKIGYFPKTNKLLQMELIPGDRLLVLTSRQLQVYNVSTDSRSGSASLIKNLELAHLERINPSQFGSFQLAKYEQEETLFSSFSVVGENQILMDSGDLIQVDKTDISYLKKIIFDKSDPMASSYLLTNIGNEIIYTIEGSIVFAKTLSEDNDAEVVIDINKWNESIAEYEEDKVEEITSLSICQPNRSLLITSHVNGEINLWDISKRPIMRKYNKILKLKHHLVQNRELLVDRTYKKDYSYNTETQMTHFKRYDYNIVDNYLATKRLNQLDENGVEWIYPYINKLQWINDHEFLSHCSRSGFIYHWDIVPFIEHDMKMFEAEEQNKEAIQKLTLDECVNECLKFKHTSGGQRRDRSPKYLEEFNIKQRLLYSTGFLPKNQLFISVSNDSTILLYKPI